MRCQTEFTEVRSAQSVQVSSAGCESCDYVRPPTSEGHNSFVRNSFQVFLDSMESPLSQEFIYMPKEDSKCQTEVSDRVY